MVGTGAIATTRTGAGSRVDVTLKLSQLQNFCKRDPQGYRDDYEAQVRRLESECDILLLSPSEPSSSLVELIQFAAAVSSSSYRGVESDRIANLLMNLLLGKQSNSANKNATNTPTSNTTTRDEQQTAVANVTSISTWALQLHRDVRKACVSALILMRNKGALDPLVLLTLFFRIMAVVPDKGLREQLYKHMVNDIRNLNKKGKRDETVNRSIQSFLHRVVSTHGQQPSSAGSAAAGTGATTSDHGSVASSSMEDSATNVAAKRATDMVCELYRRNVWTDERAVAILTSAVQSKNTSVMSKAIRFFLNIEETMAADAQQQKDDEWEGKNQIDYHLHSKKTQGRLRHVQRQVKNRQKHQRKREGVDNADNWIQHIDQDKGVETARKLYPAIELIHDPQGLAEAVFSKLRSGKSFKYETKLLMINFITRLVGNHELMLLNLYPFLQKYMGGHQRDVTAILAHTVQACHENVPPDEIYGILKTIAHNFITERCSEEQMAVGINAARAICARVPTVMSVEESKQSGTDTTTGGSGTGSTVMDIEAFARDLAGFANHRDRSVSIAGKAWTNFVREVNPGLLQGKHRGLKGSALHKAGEKPLRFGEKKVSVGVEGADLLVEYESKKKAYLKRKQAEAAAAGKKDAPKGGDDDDEEEVDDEGWVEVEDSDDESAPDLMVLDPTKASKGADEGVDHNEKADSMDHSQVEAKSKDDDGDDEEDSVIDLSKMTPEEREKLRMEVSATRVFTTEDFEKMRKLVEREQRARRDPREAARRKRALARGDGFEELSGDDDDSDDDSDDEAAIRVAGAVNPTDIMATATRKRQSKAERLSKVVAGREKFESMTRTGGSTNVEKKRTKNFVMSKFSFEARTKGKGKTMLKNKRKGKGGNLTHENKKRRRKV